SVTASDNCAYSLLQTAGLPPGSAFPIGTTLQIFKATDAAGNPHSCSFTVTVTAQQTADPALLNAYTVIGTGDISMKANQVQSGGVGIVDNNSKLKLGQGSVVTNANTFVKATQLQLIGGSQVTTYYQGQVPASLFPTFLYNTSPGTNNLTIPDNSAPVNLPLGSYGAINIGKNVVATFTGNATVKVKTLTMGDGASLRFVQDTKVLIAEGMDGGSNIRINTGSGYTSKIVQIFVAQGVTLDAGTQITATMDMLGDFKIKKATAANPNLMTGLFLAAKVTADDYTYWNWSAPTCQVNLAMTVPHKDSLGARINPAAKMMAEDILLFPNPANQEVNVSILRRIEQPFQILVYDAFGRLMEHRKLDSYVDEPLRLEVSSWPAGRYRIAVVIGSSQTVSRTFVVAR
ncbi:MAG: HYR domain-containing protein, partial [Saprospiraceae bacterium]